MLQNLVLRKMNPAGSNLTHFKDGRKAIDAKYSVWLYPFAIGP